MRKTFVTAALGLLGVGASAQTPGVLLERTTVSEPFNGGMPFNVTIEREKLDADSTKAKEAENNWQIGAGFAMQRPGGCLSATLSLPVLDLPGRSHLNLFAGGGMANLMVETEQVGFYYESLGTTKENKAVPFVMAGAEWNYLNNLELLSNEKVDITMDVEGAVAFTALLGDSLPVNEERWVYYQGTISEGESAKKTGVMVYNGVTATATTKSGRWGAEAGAGWRFGQNGGPVVGLKAVFNIH
jgi:hypothetical protein